MPILKDNCFFFVSETECSCCKDLNCRACRFFKDKFDKSALKETISFLNWYNNQRYYNNSHTPKDN